MPLRLFDPVKKLKLAKSVLVQLKEDSDITLYYTGLNSYELISGIFDAMAE